MNKPVKITKRAVPVVMTFSQSMALVDEVHVLAQKAANELLKTTPQTPLHVREMAVNAVVDACRKVRGQVHMHRQFWKVDGTAKVIQVQGEAT